MAIGWPYELGPRPPFACLRAHGGIGTGLLLTAKPDCVEPRPLVQIGPQGDSLLACGTRRRRRPSQLERARGREAHWTVVASPLPALSHSAKAEIRVSWRLARWYVEIGRNKPIDLTF